MRAIKREREILQSFSILLNAQYSTVPHYHLPLTLRGRGRNLYAKKESSSAPIQALVFPFFFFFLLFLIIVSARKVSQLSLYDFQIVWSRSSICTRLSKSSSHIQCFHSIFHREKGVVGKGKKVNFGSDFISFCLVTRRQLIRACSSRFTVAVKVVLLRKHLASQVSPLPLLLACNFKPHVCRGAETWDGLHASKSFCSYPIFLPLLMLFPLYLLGTNINTWFAKHQTHKVAQCWK